MALATCTCTSTSLKVHVHVLTLYASMGIDLSQHAMTQCEVPFKNCT